MSQKERDALILSLLAYVSPLLRMYAGKYRKLLNYEDLYQDAAVHITRLVNANVPTHELQRYSWNRVHSRIIDRIKYLTRRLCQSLDESVYEVDGVTSDDLLPSPYHVEPLTVLLAKESITALFPRIASLPRGRVALAQELGATALASLEVEH